MPTLCISENLYIMFHKDIKIKEWRIPLWWLVSPSLEPHPHVWNPIRVWNPIPMSGTHIPGQESHPHVRNPMPMSGIPSPCQESHPHIRNPIPMSGIASLCQEPHPHVRNPIPMSGTPSPCQELHPHVRNPTKGPLHLKRKFGFFQVFSLFRCLFQSYLTWVQSHLA